MMLAIHSLLPTLQHNTHVVLTCLLWYSVSSVSSQVTKHILSEFPFPLALGEFQFVIVTLLSIVTLLVLKNITSAQSLFPPGSIPAHDSPAIHPPTRHLLITVLPLGCFQFLGKLFSHSATALVPVSTVAGVKTLSPLLLVITYRFLYKVYFPTSTYLSLVPLVLGVLLIVVADSRDTLISTTASTQYIGIFYAGLSLFVFVGQNIYGKTVLTYNQKHVNDHASLALSSNDNTSSSILPVYQDTDKEQEVNARAQTYELEVEKSSLTSFPKIRNKYDKLTILLYCSIFGAILSLPWFLYIESPHFLKVEAAAEDITEAHVVFIPWTLLLINGVLHFFQSLIVFHILGAIPTVSYSIASMMKKIVVIVVSIVYTGNTITATQFVGLVLTAIGLFSYERWGGTRAR